MFQTKRAHFPLSFTLTAWPWCPAQRIKGERHRAEDLLDAADAHAGVVQQKHRPAGKGVWDGICGRVWDPEAAQTCGNGSAIVWQA
eukprot:420290-Pelagomonas_calceolata.AAC.3